MLTLVMACDAPKAAPPPDASVAPDMFVAPAASSVVIDSGPPPPEGMLLVPAGTFTMGADKHGEEDEHPAHAVTLDAFWLDATEVTNEAYGACVAASVCRAKAFDEFHRPRQPVSAVGWDDARKFCEWKGKRLPREAEMERAIRGDDGRRYPWGSDPPGKDRTVIETTAPDDVGSHPTGRGPYGHDDLMGNVWEWMQDEYDPYAYRRKTASTGTPGTCAEIMATLKELRDADQHGFTGANPLPTECERSIRGGAYNYLAAQLRSTDRVHHPGRFHIPMLGFRCAMDVKSK
jgi:formylglycine-generating enzyme required for sulfatase activity